MADAAYELPVLLLHDLDFQLLKYRRPGVRITACHARTGLVLAAHSGALRLVCGRRGREGSQGYPRTLSGIEFFIGLDFLLYEQSGNAIDAFVRMLDVTADAFAQVASAAIPCGPSAG
jgi:hypothetical protein